MKIKKMYRPPAHEVVDKTICDFCGKDIVMLEGETYEQTIEVKHGTVEPYFDGGGESTEESYDVCRPCWDLKVRPLLEKEARKLPHIEKYSW